jgi:hypothetical protein
MPEPALGALDEDEIVEDERGEDLGQEGAETVVGVIGWGEERVKDGLRN